MISTILNYHTIILMKTSRYNMSLFLRMLRYILLKYVYQEKLNILSNSTRLNLQIIVSLQIINSILNSNRLSQTIKINRIKQSRYYLV
jgi:hypothetical protein